MFLHFIIALLFVNSSLYVLCQNHTLPVNEIEQCRMLYDGKRVSHDYLKEFPTGLGVGWDNLQNIPRSNVFNFTFSKCKLSPDLEYLVPDGVHVILIKTSQLDKIAKYYETYDSYTESTSETINVDASADIYFFKISGSYSERLQEVKQHSLGQKSSIFRSKLEHHAYTALIEPGSSLNLNFHNRLVEIGDALLKNKTKLANYLSQLVIRDYGTHVVTNADVGIILVQEDFVDIKALSETKMNVYDIKMSAALTFIWAASVDIGPARDISNEDVATYKRMVSHSQYSTYGGPNVNRIWRANNTGNTSIISDNLVILDRSGIPIHFLVTKDYFPSLPLPTIARIQSYLENATNEYYKRNVIRGCQDPTAENFNYYANVNDSSCIKPTNNYTFGGLYQTCTVITGEENICRNFELKNGITGQFTCPEKYAPIKLFRQHHNLPPRKVTYSREKCYDCGWFLHHHSCCPKVYSEEIFIDEIVLDAYWCSAGSEKVPADSGYLFGGLFTSRTPNPFSSNQKCPGRFTPYTIGIDLSICMSRDYQLDYQSSVNFAGFISCGSSLHCPNGYSQHLAEIVDSCEIYYCVRPEAFLKTKKISAQMPPFMSYPYEYEALTVLQTYQDGRLWYRSAENNHSWRVFNALQENGKLPDQAWLLSQWSKQSTHESPTGSNGSFIASVAFNCVFAILLILFVAYLVRKKYVSSNSSYGPIVQENA